MAESDPLTGIDTARIRVEGSIVETLRSLDTVGERTTELDGDRRDAVDQAVHAARHSLVEALRRCGRCEGRTEPGRSDPAGDD